MPPLDISLTQDLGADPTGDTDSTDAFRALNGLSGVVRVDIPPGEYRIASDLPRIDGPDRLELHGEAPLADSDIETEYDHTRLLAPSGYAGLWLDVEASIAFESLHIDRRKYEAGPQIRLRAPAGSTNTIRDTHLVGRDDSEALTGGTIDLAGGDGATIDCTRLTIPHGAFWYSDLLARRTDTTAAETARVGLRIGSDNAGRVNLSDCRIEEHAGHGVDAYGSGGPVSISGGTYRNNNGAQIRCAHPEDRIAPRLVVTDLDRVSVERTDVLGRRLDPLSPSVYTTLQGVAIERDTNHSLTRTGTLRRARIRQHSVSGETDGQDTPETIMGPGVSVTAASGGPTITRCDIEIDHDGLPAIDADAPTDPVPAHELALQDSFLMGAATTGTALVAPGRPVSIDAGCIERPGERIPLAVPPGTNVGAVFNERCQLRSL